MYIRCGGDLIRFAALSTFPKGEGLTAEIEKKMNLPLWGRWIAEGETDEVFAGRQKEAS